MNTGIKITANTVTAEGKVIFINPASDIPKPATNASTSFITGSA
jgi:hypothetical protein